MEAAFASRLLRSIPYSFLVPNILEYRWWLWLHLSKPDFYQHKRISNFSSNCDPKLTRFCFLFLRNSDHFIFVFLSTCSEYLICLPWLVRKRQCIKNDGNCRIFILFCFSSVVQFRARFAVLRSALFTLLRATPPILLHSLSVRKKSSLSL